MMDPVQSPPRLRMTRAAWCLALACGMATLAPVDAAGRRQLLDRPGDYGKGGTPSTPTQPSIKRYNWTVHYTKAAPDCFEKNVVYVNHQFQPTIRVTRGQILEVRIKNELPPDYPSSTNGGITIHWHGLSQRNEPWQDGVAFVHQCPIMPGHEFTYRFPITDSPGTYWWHDHASGNHADGLAGLFIIDPEEGTPPLDQYDEERTVFIHDWFHTQGDVLAMSLNRPNDKAQQSRLNGGWNWVNVPQAILINQKASFYDCPLSPPAMTPVNATCAVHNYTIPGGLMGQPMASAANPGCTHASLSVEQNKTYLVRVVNAGTLDMESLCFSGHKVTIVAADATPTEPLEVECVDVNLGQRYDVLLKADQPVGLYWMRSASQYRPGSPDGYGVLQYVGKPNDTLPTEPAPQPGSTLPFTTNTINNIRTRAALLNEDTAKNISYSWPGNQTTLKVPAPTRALKIDISQPLLNQTGQLRWNLNNIAHADTPTCSALLEDVYQDNQYLQKHVANANGTGNDALGKQNSALHHGGQNLYLDNAFPLTPVAGRHLVDVKLGEVIDVVIQNNQASSFNGSGGMPPRNASEQHPFHLHGQHFWLLGTGDGPFDATDKSQLNTLNPVNRDTATVPPNGWVAFRFLADNPGLWLLHCHVFWHQFMGQTLAFAVEIDKVKKPPQHMPVCRRKCPAQFAPWRPDYVQRTYGYKPYEIPFNQISG